MQKPRYPGTPPGLPARNAALKLLDAVLRKGQPLESALNNATKGIDRSDDRALAHAIAAETLRRLPDLDALIDSATAKPLPSDAKARFALRIALVQALALGTPPHAAIATTLPLVEGGPRRLVHGVFGSLMRGEASLPELPRLPDNAAIRWSSAWGEDVVYGARRAIAAPPPLDLTLKNPGDTAQWCETLDGTSLFPGHIRLVDAGPVTQLPGYADGHWWVQDLAASLPARLLGKGDSRAVLDLCAAPGGKALQLAAAGWDVTALDRNAARLERVRENAERTGLKLHIQEADMLKWKPKAPVSAILLDAPCSATGIFRRHPDVLHRVLSTVIMEMAALQAQMLARAADWLMPGGTLLYATCSLEPQEGERQISKFLEAHSDMAIDPIKAEELPEGLDVNDTGCVRTLPGMLKDQGGLDGFFIARLVKQG